MVVDVCIVGAGLSGLVCARRLVSAGKKVVVLEASARVGGRMFGKQIRGAPFDLGGQWIGPGQDRVAALAHELGVETEPTPHAGAHLLCSRGKVVRYRGTIPKMGLRALHSIGVATLKTYALSMRVPLDGSRWTELRRYDAQSVEDAIAGGMPPEARAAFDAAFRTVFGAEARDVSFLWYLFYVRAGGGFFKLVDVEGGAQERRFIGGAYQLPVKLAAKLGDGVVQLEAPVSRITQTKEHLIVAVAATTQREVRAARVVIAAPPSIVHRSIVFSPELPAARLELAEKMRMGSTVKVLALYERPFWRDAGLSGQAATDGLLSVVFDNTSTRGTPTLVAFIVGDEASRWRARTPTDQRRAIVEQLVLLFGEEARDVEEIATHDWCVEKWTGGCPVDSPPKGVLSGPGRAASLRAPCGRVHWAGTESAGKNAGYLDGAVSAGERAAEEVLAALVAHRRSTD